MAGMLLRMGDKPNTSICEYVVDSVEEIGMLPTTTTNATGIFENDISFKTKPPIGSTCIVGNGSEEILIYMLFSNGWKQI